MSKIKLLFLLFFIIIINFLVISSKNDKPIKFEKTLTASDLKGVKINISLSKQITLLYNNSLGLKYFPDEAAVLVSYNPYKILVTSGDSTYLLKGDNIRHIKSAKKVLNKGEKGTFDNGYAGISGIYKTGKNIYAFYHGEDQENMPKVMGGGIIPGFYASIGCALSKDNGESWKKLGPVITCSRKKEWKWSQYPNHPDRGVATPGVVVSKDGKYLYLYYNEHSRIDENNNYRGVQVFMARADISKGPPLPGSWKKFYRGSFSQNGIGGMETPVLSTLDIDQAEASCPHPVYSKKLNRYIMIFGLNIWKEYITAGYKNKKGDKSGICAAFSEDGIHWSKPFLLIQDTVVPQYGRSLSWMANIIWDENSSTDGWLVYAYSPKWGNTEGYSPHYMVGRRISFRFK